MPSAVCTLFEKDYHFGVAPLTNSLYREAQTIEQKFVLSALRAKGPTHATVKVHKIHLASFIGSFYKRDKNL